MPAPRKPVDPSASPTVKRFAACLDGLVASTGMSVADLAEEADLARSSLYEVLGGRRVPNQRFIDSLLGTLERHSSWPEKKLTVALRRAESLHTRLSSKPARPRRPAPPVVVDVLPEQTELAEAFIAFLDYVGQQGVDVEQLAWTSPRWLSRYAWGDSIPSYWTLYYLRRELEDRGVSDVPEQISVLAQLTYAARTARAKERRWARVLAGGSP
ncbi:helix-turn-helix domain-containing protein [Kitasatospora sp. NPDC054795]